MDVTGLKIVMRSSTEDSLDIDLLNEIYHDANEAWWMGGTTAQDFADKLAGKSPKTINVRINSNGGVVSDGVAIYNLLREKARAGAAVNVTVLGMAASAATIVAMAGDTRKMATGSRMMIHSAGIMGRLPFSNATDLRKIADTLDSTDQTIAEIYQKASGKKSKQDFLDLMAAETYFSADEAVQHGLATETDAGLPAVALATDSIAVVACRTGSSACAGPASAPTNQHPQKEDPTMQITKEQLLKEAPELANALRQEGRDAAVSEHSNERQRIKDVLALKSVMPGHDAAIDEMAFDGKTTVEFAKARLFDIESANRTQALAALQNGVQAQASVPAPAAGAPLAQGGAQEPPKTVANDAPVEERAKAQWETDVALRNEFDTLEDYTAWMRGVERGAVKGYSLTNAVPARRN